MERRGHIATLAMAAVLSFPRVALAQTGPTAFDDASVRQYVRLVLENIHRAKCDDGLCAPATKQELDNPPVSIADARIALYRGFVSAMGGLCGLDWQGKNFLPMTRHWRSSGMPDRPVAILVLLHGIAQGQAEDALVGKSCGSKASVEAQLTFKP